MEHVRRLLPMVRGLAERALSLAVDASPHRPREGECVISLMHALPAARRLLGDDTADTSAGVEALRQAAPRKPGQVKVVDGRGHHRLAYHYLMIDLHQRVSPGGLMQDHLVPESDGQLHHNFLRGLCRHRTTRLSISRNSKPDHGPQPLHEQTPDDTPEAWVYREMVALHGMFNLAMVVGDDHLLPMARRAALYHLDHIQPDYTTYQPWALSAFAYWPQTVVFAEQQLHDVTSHLSIEGGPGALVPGLLLADAWATLRSVCAASIGE